MLNYYIHKLYKIFLNYIKNLDKDYNVCIIILDCI